VSIPILKKGSKAYYEGINALIPMQALRVRERPVEMPEAPRFELENGCLAASTRYLVTMKVLEARSGYDIGDVFEESALHVFPRACLKRSKYSTVVKPFGIELTEEDGYEQV
jgi:hypothetical protein